MNTIVAILLMATVTASAPNASKTSSPCGEIHPLLGATEDSDGNLTGFEGKCPKGMKATDPKHLLHANMTYAQSINAIAGGVCVPAK